MTTTDDVKTLIGNIISVKNDAGVIAYKSTHNKGTTVADLRNYRAFLATKAAAADRRLAAVTEAIDRCGSAPDETPLIEAIGRQE